MEKTNNIEELCNSCESWECPICHAIMHKKYKAEHISKEVKDIQESLRILSEI